MSIMEGKSAMTHGPLRPIPIHLPRPSGHVDSIGFHLPGAPMRIADRPVKPTPRLWNPALDLRTTPSTKSNNNNNDIEKHDRRDQSPLPMQHTSISSTTASPNQTLATSPSETINLSRRSRTPPHHQIVTTVPGKLIPSPRKTPPGSQHNISSSEGHPNDCPSTPTKQDFSTSSEASMTPPSHVAPNKLKPDIGVQSFYKNFERNLPNGLENHQLAFLEASKGAFFPHVLSRMAGNPMVPVSHGITLTPGAHLPQHHVSKPSTSASSDKMVVSSSVPAAMRQEPFASLTERHISLQNALALAQTRAVMDRLNSGANQGHPPHLINPSAQLQSLRNPPLPRPPTLNPPQGVLPPPPPHPPGLVHPNHPLAPPQHGPNSSHLLHGPVPLTQRSLSLQNALALAQSRAILDSVHHHSSQLPTPPHNVMLAMEGPVSHGYGRKLFPCPQCRYTTDRRNNLKRHMLTMHQTSSKMLECCGIFFNTKASLREHAMIFHYHGYTCYFCGRRFCRKALLKRHLSVHNGQKDFVCNVCDYATSHKSNLERHRKVHSRQDGEDEEMKDGQHYMHDDIKSNSSEAVSHEDVSSDELSVCSDYEDDIDVEINVHSD